MKKNLSNTEKLHRFDQHRDAFRPYGLTCELWTPHVMRKPDRHNEIEINYFAEGSITYLFRGSKITIPPKSMGLFWGLVPHQIVDYKEYVPYFVCTIPLAQFLEWNLPTFLVDRILKGEVIIEGSGEHSLYDPFMLMNWIDDLSKNDGSEVTLLEMQARFIRLANRVQQSDMGQRLQIHSANSNHVERIAMYIAKNYSRPIKASDIGEEVGLHPDYANVVFKKAFGSTLNEYIIQERISQAQRKLVASDKSITDISYECGFNSISSFNAAFKRINKCTPREYRNVYV
ncbi:helix-turn-helix domain-containing protein [Arenibacter aquaticus]|uniref:Helix-turn-helix domain-containing protein n=1 Tax=Arenibacter aquaticus TaxID=2489054 RepID=A0A3S0C510_9FLAO|nr:helix-turn-helix domain-containing protein [Arenibacter aquaticus]RTE52290.1 helix-turn-helix domain-containing protein [Arenibacter aquaticus]